MNPGATNRFTTMVAGERSAQSVYLGVVDYAEAFDLQEQIVRRQITGDLPDVLLTLQHPPTITVGVSGNYADVRVDKSFLKSKGVELVKTNRGGKATYHGPGQLVVYPLIELKRFGPGLRDYMALLENVTISVLNECGIQASRVQGKPGVWVEGRKIASIGIRLRRGRTMHGIAVNLTTDLAYFDLFVPCGMPEVRMTSLKCETGTKVDLHDVRKQWIKRFADETRAGVFNVEVEQFLAGLRECETRPLINSR